MTIRLLARSNQISSTHRAMTREVRSAHSRAALLTAVLVGTISLSVPLRSATATTELGFVSGDLGTGRGATIVSGPCSSFGTVSEPSYDGGYYCWVGPMLNAYTGENGYDCIEYSVECVHPEPNAKGMGGTCFAGPDGCDTRPIVVEAASRLEYAIPFVSSEMLGD